MPAMDDEQSLASLNVSTLSSLHMSSYCCCQDKLPFALVLPLFTATEHIGHTIASLAEAKSAH